MTSSLSWWPSSKWARLTLERRGQPPAHTGNRVGTAPPSLRMFPEYPAAQVTSEMPARSCGNKILFGKLVMIILLALYIDEFSCFYIFAFLLQGGFCQWSWVRKSETDFVRESWIIYDMFDLLNCYLLKLSYALFPMASCWCIQRVRLIMAYLQWRPFSL